MREIREGADRAVQREADGVLIDLGDALLLQERHGSGGGRRVGGIDKALEAGDDIVGGHGAAVVELDALAEREGPDLAAFGWLPRGREHGAERQVRLGVDEVFGGLLDDGDAAGAVQLDRVDGGGGRYRDLQRAAALGGGGLREG